MRLSLTTAPIHVLHVDDDREFVELSAALLERERDAFRVDSVTSVDAALERLRDGSIDCVVSDFEMPGTDGLAFLRTVRQRYPDMPFILFTGRGSETIADEAVSAGVTDYLQKRSGVDQFVLLANRIEQAVSRTRAERTMEQGFRAMDLTDEAIALLDTAGRFTFVNAAFADLFGYERDGLIGEEWSVVIPDGGSSLERLIDADGARDQRHAGKATLVDADGTPIVVDYSLGHGIDGTTTTALFVSDATKQNARERTLHEERRRLDRFVDAVGEYAIFALDPEGYVTSWNKGATRIKGYTRDEIVGEHVSTFYPPEAVEADVPADLLTQARTEGWVEDEGWRVRKDGSRFWATVTITALRDEEGSFAGFVKVTRDTTNRHRREEERRRDERFLEAALDRVEDVFYVLDTEFGFRRVNDRLATVTGYTRDELDAMDVFDLVDPTEHAAVRAHLRRTLDERESSTELTVRTSDDETVPFEVNHAALFDEAGNPLGIVGIGRDLSGRKEYERTLELRTRQQAAVAGLGHRALGDVALDEVFDEAVRVVAETLGADYCKVLELDDTGAQLRLRSGVGWKEGYVGAATVDTDTRSQAGYTLLSEEPVVVSDLQTETRFSGPALLTDHEVRSGISVIIGSVDDPWGILGVHDTQAGGFADRDVAFVRSVANVLASAVENRDHRQRLERQNEQLERFASVLSHDLRNPLSVAQGRLELARRTGEDEHFDAVDRAHRRMQEMVDELLSSARGYGESEDLDEVVLSSVVESAWDVVETADASLCVERDGRIDAEPGPLRHVFENLFRNAVQHGGESVTVRVGMFDDAQGFYVEDDGAGIPGADRERVFEKGFTSDESGNGFGLHIVASVVAAQGWDIAAVEGRDGGARFEVAFATTPS